MSRPWSKTEPNSLASEPVFVAEQARSRHSLGKIFAAETDFFVRENTCKVSFPAVRFSSLRLALA
jgi:hypothetical protein